MPAFPFEKAKRKLRRTMRHGAAPWRFLKFMAAAAWLYWVYNYRFMLFSERMVFFKALHPYVPKSFYADPNKTQSRIGWPDGFLFLQPEDVRRALSIMEQQKHTSSH